MSLALGIGLGLDYGGNLFSPAQLFGLSEPGAWYDPSDLSTMFTDTAGTTPVTAAGQAVARINDKSGRGNHATQSVLAARPLYQVDANGRGYLSFDGSDDFLVTPTITPATDKVQVFAGVRDSALTTVQQNIIELSAGTGDGRFLLHRGLDTLNKNLFQSRGTLPSSVGSATPSSPVTLILTGFADISGDSATLRVNGAQANQSTADQGTGNYLAYPIYIGRRGGTTLPFNGRLYGLIVRFGPNLSATAISQTEVWMNSKTGAY